LENIDTPNWSTTLHSSIVSACLVITRSAAEQTFFMKNYNCTIFVMCDMNTVIKLEGLLTIWR